MVRSSARLTAILLGSAVFSAWALGFGDLAVTSGLGQPLRARIPLLDVSPANAGRIHVGFPPKSVFASAGVERPPYLDKIHVKVVTRGGKASIRLTTKQPLRTPYLDLLLQIRAPGERLVREFTALINPAGNSGGQQAAPSSSTAASGASPGVSTQSPVAATHHPRQISRYGPVARNETLWHIANKLHGRRGVSIYQMLVGLYRKNPGAFQGSMNALKAGSELNVPSKQYLDSVGSHQAREVVERDMRARAQRAAAAGGHGTLKLVAAAKTAPGSRSNAVAPGGGSSQNAAAAGAHSGLIRISNQALAMLEEKALQSQGNPFKADPLPPASAAQAGAHTVAQGATGQQAHSAPATPKVATALSAATPPAAAPVKAGSAAKTASAKPSPSGHPVDHKVGKPSTAKAVPKGGPAAVKAHGAPPTPAAAPSAVPAQPVHSLLAAWWHDLVSNRTVQAGLLLLLLVILLISRRRRAKWVGDPGGGVVLDGDGEGEDADDEGKAGGSSGEGLAAAMQASEDDGGHVIDNGLRIRAGEPVVAEASEPEDAQVLPNTVEDALADADFNMTYGLYDEALAGLRQSSLGYPGEHTLRLKELEVLFSAGRADEFLAQAQSLRGELTAADRDGWDRVVRMSKALFPQDPLFLRSGDQIGDGADLQPPQADAEARADAGERAHAAPANDDAAQPAVIAKANEAEPEAVEPQGEAQQAGAAANAEQSIDPATPPDEDRDHVVEFDIDDLDTPSSSAEANAEDILEIPGIDFETSEAGESPLSAREGTAAADEEEGGADDWERFLSSGEEAVERPVANGWDEASHDTSSLRVNAAEPEQAELADSTPSNAAMDEPVSDDDGGDDVDIKLSLARAYVDMGEREMAAELIGEVIGQGSDAQRGEAEALREKLG